jgi:uncharacterized protein YfdQ (DUF2303 family)
VTNVETEVGAAFEAGREQIQKFDVAEHVVFIVRPSGDGETTIEQHDLEQYQPHPRRIAGGHTVRDVSSFVRYLSRHKTSATVAYAKPGGEIVGVLDDHGPAESHDEDDSGVPGWRKHTVALKREETRGWAAWRAVDDKWQSQTEFAEFLEERIGEITRPAGADLFELAQHFHADKSISLRSRKRLSNGETQIEYVELIEGGSGPIGTLQMPESIQIAVSPYYDSLVPADERTDDDVPEDIVATLRLRWRLTNDGKVHFKFLFPEDLIERLRAIDDGVIAQVEDAGVPVFRVA